METDRPLTIVVLLGGPSQERKISLASGAGVAAALEERGHRIVRFDPNAGFPDDGVLDRPIVIGVATLSIRRFDWSGVDVAFNALHGPFGEDGRLQQLLVQMGVPFTGSSAHASKVGFHKGLAKRRLSDAGLLTPRGLEVTAHCPFDRDAAATLSLPLVVKPDAQGSSLGRLHRHGCRSALIRG